MWDVWRSIEMDKKQRGTRSMKPQDYGRSAAPKHRDSTTTLIGHKEKGSSVLFPSH